MGHARGTHAAAVLHSSPAQHINIVRRLNIAFVRFHNRLNAEFAKVAMGDQVRPDVDLPLTLPLLTALSLVLTPLHQHTTPHYYIHRTSSDPCT